MRQPPVFEINQCAAAEIDPEWQLMFVCDGGEFGFRYGCGETLYGVVAGVHLHQRRGAFVDGLDKVFGVGAVGGADFAQLAARARHDVWNAKGAADLNEFAARDDDFFFLCKGVEHQINGGGIVVHDHRGLGACQTAQPLFDVAVAFAACATVDIEFEIDRARHRLHGRFSGDLADECAAEVGVQHGTGEIEHRPHRRTHGGGEVFCAAFDQGGFVSRFGVLRHRRALRINDCTDGFDD